LKKNSTESGTSTAPFMGFPFRIVLLGSWEHNESFTEELPPLFADYVLHRKIDGWIDVRQ